MVLDGPAYKQPAGVVWNTLFLVFFVIGGGCSTLIPLSCGSDTNWVGRFLKSPVSGKTAEQLAATSPEDLDVGDLPPAVILVAAAIVSMSLLSWCARCSATLRPPRGLLAHP
jgi:hypothetical protein